jgi:DNA-binding NarL/FixJ family response regulator
MDELWKALCFSETTDMDTVRRPPPKPSVPALRIFLVEDSSAVRDLIVSELANIPGIAWAGFSDSENDALEQLHGHPCDVLIVDIELRQGNGISLLRKLSMGRGGAGELKIVFTNNVCDAYRRAGAQYGVHHFFDKSFDLPRLRELLERMGAALPQA